MTRRRQGGELRRVLAADERPRLFGGTDRRLHLAAVLAVVVGAALWIELGNRTAIEIPANNYPCADSDAIPYGARCIEFMMGSRLQDAPDADN